MSKLVNEKRILGIGPRLLSAADKLAPLAGTANGLLRPFLAKGGGSAAGALGVVKSGIRGFKFASPIDTTMSAINDPATYPIVSGIGSWIGGLLAEQVGAELGGQIGDFMKKGGSAAMKFGTSSAFMGVLSAYFLEQGAGAGPLNMGIGAVQSISGGFNSRLRQDNPDINVDARQGGVIAMPAYGGVEY